METAMSAFVPVRTTPGLMGAGLTESFAMGLATGLAVGFARGLALAKGFEDFDGLDGAHIALCFKPCF